MNLKALRDKINGIADQIEEAIKNEEYSKAVELKAQHKELMEQYDALKDLEIQRMEEPANAYADPKKVDKKTEEFLNAVRSGFANLMSGETDENGGYIVPEDVQTQINRFKENERSLRQLVRVERTSKRKGSRVYQTKAAAGGFQQVDENGLLQAMDEPTFTPVTYEIKDYGGYLPVTNDLLNDTDADLTGTIVRWVGKNSLATDNAQIIEILEKGSPVAMDSIDKIQTAAYKTVGSAYNVTIVTNDSGALWLAQQKDANRRPLIQPNPAEPTKMQICVGAKVFPVEIFPDTTLANVEVGEGSSKTEKPPVIIGDLKEAVALFDRQQTTMYKSTDAAVVDSEGKVVYNAFQQRGQLYRADMRADYVEVDSDAWVFGVLG